ncbi:MAG: non-ribosomal peptide synthetase [Chloroflexota bacterium]
MNINNDYIANSPLQRQINSNGANFSTNGFVEFEIAEIEQSIPGRFEKIVKQYPDQVAIKTASACLTFDQLNRTANRIARVILRQGEGTGMAGVLIEQGAAFLASMFGVLKTGKIYVPMDPSFPRERLTQIVEDSQPGLIITNSDNLALAKALVQGKCQLINIDDIDLAISAENLDLPISPDTLAYIIYTSGSTGQPKGVVQNHRNVLHNCRNQSNIFRIDGADRVILLYSCSVMGAVRVIYNALMKGAGLYYVDVKKDGIAELTRMLIQEKITVYHSVPSLFRHFANTLTGANQVPSLRRIILGGEATLKGDVELYRQYFSSHSLLYSGIGSTEVGTMRQLTLDKETVLSRGVVPPGYPVENMTISILDDEGKEVAPGEVGEIAVRSKYLALGYWNKPELTQAVFRDDPAGSGERTYLTGDLGCILADGCLVHLGRKDFQVKIRGFRVELAEIEIALRESGQVTETVVVGHRDTSGNTRLIAYVVPGPGSEITRRDLRNFLQSRLPDYMMPSAFVILEALPRTPNGKIDRQALPTPDLTRPEREQAFVAPQTPTEELLAEIWADVLKTKPVGRHDNFLELGGHSLLATQIVSRIRDALHLELPLHRFFETSTVAGLAQTIEQLTPDGVHRQTSAIAPVPRMVYRRKRLPAQVFNQ